MNLPRDPDPIIATWLEDGPIDLPADTRRAIVVGLRTQPRARQVAILRGLPMSPLSRLATAAAVVVVVGAISILVLSNRGGGPGGPQSSSAASPPPSPPASPGPSASVIAASIGPALFTQGSLTTYTSTRYGFSISHPADWTEVASDHVWALPADADWQNTAAESFKAPGGTVRVSAWSVSIHPAELVDRPTMTWVATTYCPVNTTPCTGLESRTTPVTMDGHAGSMVQFQDDTQAFVLIGDRMYVVAVWEPDSDPRIAPYGGAQRLLKDFLATVRLLPGGPVSPSTAPGPS